MKLIRCHIENFGVLHDFDYAFNDGINIIHAENGWGKSTFASFIRVMFYGFDRETKKSMEERERVQKAPWQSGVYGGSIVFEAHGKTYRMIRTFDTRKASKDTFELYDETTGLASDDYGNRIGEQLFDIDSDSFEKTVYIGQLDCLSGVSDQISARIGNISRETADMGNYEQAVSLLNAKINRLSDKRATGLCHKLKEEIGAFNVQISRKPSLIEQAKDVVEQIHACRDEITHVQSQMDALGQKISEAAEYAQTQADNREYADRKQQAEEMKLRVEKEEEWFVRGIPSLQEVEQIQSVTRKMESQLVRCESLALSGKEKLTLEQFGHLFSCGVPGSDLLSVIGSNVAEYELVHQTINNSTLSDHEMEQLAKGRNTFSGKNVDEALISSMPVMWQNLNKAESQLHERGQNRNESRKQRLVIGGCFLVGSAVLLVLKQIIPAILFALAGVLVVIDGLRMKGDSDEVGDLKEKVQQMQNRIDAFIKDFDLNISECPECFYALLHEYREWQSLEERYQGCMDENMRRKESRLYRRLQDFFFPLYGKTDDFKGRYEKLQNDINEYDALIEKRDRFTHERQELQNSMQTIRGFLQSYGFIPSSDLHQQIASIRDHVISYNEALKTMQASFLRLDEFEQSHDVKYGMDEQMDMDLPQLQKQQQSLLKQKEDLQQHMHNLSVQKQKMDEAIDEIETMEAEVSEKKEQLDQYMHQLWIAEMTLQYLTNARNSFTAKYMTPIRERFDVWYALLSGNDQKQYELDAGLNIRLIAYGKGRNMNTMSNGYRDLVGLCRRMAMIDAMYEKEKPFIILDDPFVNLDDERMACVQQFINAISKDCQVIYMTCHTGRLIHS